MRPDRWHEECEQEPLNAYEAMMFDMPTNAVASAPESEDTVAPLINTI